MKYISEDKRIFDTAEECLTHEITLELKESCKLYDNNLDEITNYANLAYIDIKIIKVIDAEKFMTALDEIADNTNDIDLYLDDFYELIDDRGTDLIINNHCYVRTYNAEYLDITTAIDAIGR